MVKGKISLLKNEEMMMRRVKLVLVVVGVLLFSAQAFGVLVPLTPASLDDLLGSAVPVGVVKATVMDGVNLKSVVYSQAYTDGAGLYAYLYQVQNTGAAGNSILEQFTAAPFEGADQTVSMGYLTGALPAGFMPGASQVPEPDGNVNIPSGPVVSFYFGDRYGYGIDIGEHSAIMYVLSSLPVSEITGNVIDGEVASGPVVGPVPEPATVLLLGLGGLVLIGKKNSHRSQRGRG